MAIQPVPPIDPALPAFPGPNTPEAQYDDAAYNWGSAIPGYGNRVKAIGDNVFNNANAAAAILELCEDAQRLTEMARDTAMGVANFKGDWVNLSGSLARPATVQHNNSVWLLMRDVANVAAEVPGVSTAWVNQTARVSSVMGRTGDVIGLTEAAAVSLGAAAMSTAPLGQWAIFISSGTAGSDWPTTLGTACWNVFTFGTSTRKTQRASQVLAGAQQGWTYERQLQDTTWSAWERVFTAGSLVERGKYFSAAAPTYAIDPAVASVNWIDIYNASTINVPNPRSLGDQLTIKLSVVSASALTFSSNVKAPSGGLPALTAGTIMTLVLTARQDGTYWDVHGGGTNPW